jgi:subtilisin family serine protease
VLAGRVLSGFNFLTNATNTAETLQNVDTSANGEFDELYGHGTLVAGIVARLAPAAHILPITVMDSDGMATIFRLSQGLYYALDSGAQVANVSMGMEFDPQLLREVIAEVESAGLMVVASAGNRANSNPDYPAGASNVGLLAVTATTDADVRAEFSNYGTWVSLSAPGVDVVGPVPGGGYGIASGTSLSAPMVAAGAALVRSICPLISNAQVDAILRERATPIDGLNPGYVGQLGSGRLSLAASVGVGAATLFCDCDRNNDRRVTFRDLYLMHTQMVDANGDGVANSQDVADLRNWLRARETRQLLSVR